MQAERSAFFICQTSVMPLLGGKGTGLPRIRVKAALRAGRLKENHPRYAPVFSFAKPCRKRAIRETKACKIGKTDPEGIIIHS